jgi:hypothetical protein
MSPETIRPRALECMRLAQNLTESQHRTLLLDLAHCWANLANAMDRYQLFAEAMQAGSIDDVRPRARPRPQRAVRPPRRRPGLKGSSSAHRGRRQAKASPLQRIAGR